MSSQFVVVVTDSMDVNTVNSEISLSAQSPSNTEGNNPGAWDYLRKLGSYFQAGSDGAKSLKVTVLNGAVAATGTITFSSLANNDTVTVNGRVYTAKTSGATGLQQFNLGGSDAAAALNFQAAVNADTSTLVSGVVTASSSSSAVSLITAVVPGVAGNGITIAISAHGSVSGSGLLTGGAMGGVGTISAGV